MNTLFLTAITGECCLVHLCNVWPPYNPFVLLRKNVEPMGVKLPKKRKAILEWLLKVYKDNHLEPHALLQKAIDKPE